MATTEETSETDQTQDISKLDPRKRAVLKGTLNGARNKNLARDLDIAKITVSRIRNRLADDGWLDARGTQSNKLYLPTDKSKHIVESSWQNNETVERKGVFEPDSASLPAFSQLFGVEENNSEQELVEIDDLQNIDVSKDDLYSALSNSRRRAVLRYMREFPEKNPFETGPLSENIAALELDKDREDVTGTQRKRVYIGLSTHHLEALDDIDILNYDKDRQTFTYGPAYAVVLPHISQEFDDSQSVLDVQYEFLDEFKDILDEADVDAYELVQDTDDSFDTLRLFADYRPDDLRRLNEATGIFSDSEDYSSILTSLAEQLDEEIMTEPEMPELGQLDDNNPDTYNDAENDTELHRIREMLSDEDTDVVEVIPTGSDQKWGKHREGIPYILDGEPEADYMLVKLGGKVPGTTQRIAKPVEDVTEEQYNQLISD